VRRAIVAAGACPVRSTSETPPQPARAEPPGGIPAADTAIELSALMQPADANFLGVIHGGVILKQIDEAAGTCAYHFARRRVVTAAIDRMSFHYPVQIGNLVVCRATVNWAGHSSMEIGVRVEAEDLATGAWLHTNSAYLVFVALDDQRRPTAVPRLLLETDDERRRWAAAVERRRARLAERVTDDPDGASA